MAAGADPPWFERFEPCERTLAGGFEGRVAKPKRVTWLRRLVLACSAFVLVVALAGGRGAHAATTGTGLEGVPAYTHVAIVVLENEDFATTWSPSSPAKYLNSLVPRGVLATDY